MFYLHFVYIQLCNFDDCWTSRLTTILAHYCCSYCLLTIKRLLIFHLSTSLASRDERKKGLELHKQHVKQIHKRGKWSKAEFLSSGIFHILRRGIVSYFFVTVIVIVTVIMISAMIKHYDCDYDCDRKIRYKFGPKDFFVANKETPQLKSY